MPINHNKKRLLCFVLFLMAFIGLTCCKTVVAKDIGDDEKVYNKDWIYLEDKNNIYIDRYIGKAEKVIIPSKINGKKVVGIGDEAFHNNKIIKSVDIPETVKEILDYAFFSCTKLKTIRFL